MTRLTRVTSSISDTEDAKWYKRGSFSTGYYLRDRKEVLLNNEDGFYYQYLGSLPITVPAGTKPDKVNWKCVGDANYPLTVESYGADPTGQVDSSRAFQLMFDNLNYIKCSFNQTYLIDAPIVTKGQYWYIDGNKSTLLKKTATRPGTPLQKVGSKWVKTDIPCVITSTGDVRYWTIRDIYIDMSEAPLSNLPLGIFIPKATNYFMKGVNTRGGYHGVKFCSAWRGTLSDLRINETSSHGLFYDSSRLDAEGNSNGRDQTATSVVFEGVYVNTPGGSGFRLESMQYSNMTMCACDGAGSSSYYFDTCDMRVSVGAEHSKSHAIEVYNSSLDIMFNYYEDDIEEDLKQTPLIKVSNDCKVHMACNGYRSERTHIVDVAGNDRTHVTMDASSFWNGTSTAFPAVKVSDASYFEAHLEGGEVYSVQQGRHCKVSRSAPSFKTIGYLGSRGKGFSSPIMLFQKSSDTEFTLPVWRITEMFPQYGSGFASSVYFKVTVYNGSGVATGAVFGARTTNSLDGTSTAGQIKVGNGSAQAEVTSITQEGGNIKITCTGVLGDTAYLKLEML